jgi:hypothetical protein
LGVEEPSRPESSTAVSVSESASSEVSVVGGGRSTLDSDEGPAGEALRGEFRGERIRYRWPAELIFVFSEDLLMGDMDQRSTGVSSLSLSSLEERLC